MEIADKGPNGPRSRRKNGRWRKKKNQNSGLEKETADTLASLMQNTTIDDSPVLTTTVNKRKRLKRSHQKKGKTLIEPQRVEDSEEETVGGVSLIEPEVPVQDEPSSPVELESSDLDDDSESDNQSGNEEQIIKDYITQMSTNAGPSFLGINLSNEHDHSAPIDSWEWSQVDPIAAQPRPKRKQKGTWTQPPHVSDPELQEKIESAWGKDRLAKSRRKKEREALRHRGLLKAKKDGLLDELYDIRSLYPTGLLLPDLRRELGYFCSTDSHLHLALPPTNSAARRSIHLIAHKMGLKSKSHGKNDDRYIIISKVATVDMTWNEKAFDRMAKSCRLVHVLKSGPTAQKDTWEDYDPLQDDGSWNKEPPKRLGALKAKGWMEKMGWTEGQGLGSTENQGIVDPILVQQRYNRGGLGWGG